MALSLIYGTYKYAQGKIGVETNEFLNSLVTFDTMLSEEHRYSSRVTHFPVESGRVISDHIIKQPDVIVLSGFITDTPLTIFAPFNRSVAAFNTLVQIHERRLLVTVVTGIKVYRGMAITNLDVPRTVKTGQTLTFNIEFQRVVFDDTVQVLTNQNNVFAGIQDVTTRTMVSDNTNIPFIQNDPVGSLKDQATSKTNVGVQSLNTIPAGIIPNVINNIEAIAGVS